MVQTVLEEVRNLVRKREEEANGLRRQEEEADRVFKECVMGLIGGRRVRYAETIIIEKVTKVVVGPAFQGETVYGVVGENNQYFRLWPNSDKKLEILD